jgi:hypothetical protein
MSEAIMCKISLNPVSVKVDYVHGMVKPVKPPGALRHFQIDNKSPPTTSNWL